MSLNIFVSQRHIQTLQIRNTQKKKTGMCAEDLHRLERNSYQMRLRFYTFVAKMTNICCRGVSDMKKRKPQQTCSKVTAQ